MSIYNCHKQQPQPWMSYISRNKIVYPGNCCPALVTGNRCDVESIEVLYGYLYNWYAATDVRNIAASGWRVPTQGEFESLGAYLGCTFSWPDYYDVPNTAGGALKEVGMLHWSIVNVGAVNSTGFNGRGASYRLPDGSFAPEIGTTGQFWSSSVFYWYAIIDNHNANLTNAFGLPKYGISVRLIKDTTSLSHGQTGTYTGNDGKVYRTICIGTQEWLADNLCETLYRNGDPIPEVTVNATWAALTTGARCSFNNDESNALTETTICGQALLPFQIISHGAFMKMEYTLYGEDSWSEITLPVTTVMTDGFFIHSYNGEPLASALPCGVYEFRLIAGETWWFEPIMIQDFDIVTNAFSKVDELMTPLKISDQLIDTTPLIAPCDRILPFMYRTSNATTGTVTAKMVDSDGNETALSITVQTGTIDGKTYYWHRGECLYPFLTCGKYYLKIVDGAFTYYSVPFVPECGISDIPDGYQPMVDFNNCVMRDDEGNILYEECSDIPPEIEYISYGLLYNWYAATDVRNIAASGWHVPTVSEWQSLLEYIGGWENAAPKLKEVGTIYWASPNAGATNEYGFNLRGAGYRETNAYGETKFVDLRHTAEMATSEVYTSPLGVYSIVVDSMNGDDAVWTPLYIQQYSGRSVRLVKDVTSLSHGQTGTYVGNDGNVYRTICIGDKEWLADNLCETLYRNGDPIPEVTDNAAWAALTTGAMCAYNNDWNNV